MFKRAERKKVKLKIAITGPSGAGKTYSALLIAQGIGSKIAFIDTENGSASLYSDKFQFDVIDISPPYTIQKYNDGIKAAVDGGYDVLVVDSLSHAWAGEGGILQQKEQLDSRPGSNSFVNWGKLTPQQESLKSAILNADVHMIATMRSKQEYALNPSTNKLKVEKLGMAPIQREGMEYEFTLVLDMDMNHNASVSKDRTSLFDGQVFKPTSKTGATLISWLAGGDIKIGTTATKTADPLPENETFEVTQAFLGKLFSEALLEQNFVMWVNEELEKNYAKTHPQLKRFHKFARAHGAYAK